MDTSMWQTTSQIHFLHSSNKWLSPKLSCGEHGTSLSIRAIPRLRNLQEILKTRNQHQVEFGAFSEAEHLYQSVGCARSKPQCLTVPRNMIFFSLDAGLRMDGLLALDVSDMVIEVLRTTQGVPKPSASSFGETGSIPKNTPEVNHVLTQNVDLSNVDQVSANAHLFEKKSQLHIFEDNEAVIKMIIKGRSLTMRHANNSQSCVGLVVRQNQFGSQDSNQVCWHQNQMADMLSKALSCRKDLKKVLRTIHRRWKQSRDQKRWILCRIETCLLQVRILKMRMIPNSWGVAERPRCSTATGNRCKRAQKVCPCTLKRGHKESQVKLVPSILSRM